MSLKFEASCEVEGHSFFLELQETSLQSIYNNGMELVAPCPVCGREVLCALEEFEPEEEDEFSAELEIDEDDDSYDPDSEDYDDPDDIDHDEDDDFLEE